MKLQHKLLALAVMGLAAAAPAQAKIAISSTNPSGEMFMSIWHDNGTALNTSDDVSYTRDLGMGLVDWAGASSPYTLAAAKTTAGYVQSFAADSRLTNFLSSMAVGAVLKWNVIGADTFGADRVLTTVNGSPLGAIVSDLSLIGGIIDTHLAQVNPLADTQNATPSSANAIHNSNTANQTNGAAYAGGADLGANIGGKAAFNTAGGLGDALSFYLFYQPATSTPGTDAASYKRFTDALNPAAAATWKLASNGTLTYSVAAVPEADTWAMFAAGLLAVGAIARRRMAA